MLHAEPIAYRAPPRSIGGNHVIGMNMMSRSSVMSMLEKVEILYVNLNGPIAEKPVVVHRRSHTRAVLEGLESLILSLI